MNSFHSIERLRNERIWRDLPACALVFFLMLCTAGTAAGQKTLKDSFIGSFRIGAALNEAQFSERDSIGAAVVKAQFNSITSENVLKWERVHPLPDQYNFEPGDRYVTFGQNNRMFIVGHTLVWHAQTPAWVFEGEKGKPADRELLLKRLREHIITVVGHYKGRIAGWDVVNEALQEDGNLRPSPWLRIIGDDYIAKAFQFAHEADPQAELYYNDYSLENEAKRKGAIELIRKLQSEGVPIAAVGMQGHLKMDWPSAEQESAAITDLEKLGIKVNITELDIDVLPAASRQNGADITLHAGRRQQLDPFTNGLPEEMQRALAKRYADLFRVYVTHQRAISRVTFWGVTDRDSWLNNWPVRGRTSYPLLFDRQGRPKPAFDAVVGLTGAKGTAR